MAALSQKIFSGAFLLMKVYTLIIFPKNPIDNNQTVVKIMGWRRIGHKPVSASMLTRFTDAYIRRYRELI